MKTRTAAVMPITQRPDVVFVEGRGSRLVDRHGRRWLDFVQGWAVNSLGHAPARVQQVLAEQGGKLIGAGPGFYTEPMLRLATRLSVLSGLDQAFFANSGAEANEGAVKLARKWGALHKGGAHRIIAMENGFHGRTLAMMSASGKPQWQGLFEPRVPGFAHARFNDFDSLAALIDDDTVAVMLEPIQGEGGVVPASEAFMRGLRELCDAHGLLLIIDEVQTGIGRSGELFAFQRYGVKPDILTLGKGLGGGVPISAMLCREAISCFEPGDQGGTFNGNALVCAVADAVVEAVAAADFLAAVRAQGQRLRSGLEGLSARYGLGPVSGEGLLLALDTAELNAPALVARAFERGLIINAPRPQRLRFMPALNVGAGEIDEMVTILDGVLREVCNG